MQQAEICFPSCATCGTKWPRLLKHPNLIATEDQNRSFQSRHSRPGKASSHVEATYGDLKCVVLCILLRSLLTEACSSECCNHSGGRGRGGEEGSSAVSPPNLILLPPPLLPVSERNQSSSIDYVVVKAMYQ